MLFVHFYAHVCQVTPLMKQFEYSRQVGWDDSKCLVLLLVGKIER